MNNGTIGAICGSDTKMTALAIGKALQALAEQKHVIVIQFLKSGHNNGDWTFLKRLEPELKLFRFEKSEKCFQDLTDGEKEEVHLNIINGLNFAKKVMATGECELLILDGILGLCEHQIVSADEFKQILASQGDVELIVTGEILPEGMEDYMQSIEQITER